MKSILQQLLAGRTLAQETAAHLVREIASDTTPPVQIATALAIMGGRGLTLAELQGLCAALREMGTPLDLGTDELLDVCGTGGDGKNTFNISTLAAFVLAGAGVKVAKHGNYSATSMCGSSNVLEFLGLRFTADADILRNDLARANICILHAPLFQPALRRVGALRRELGFRTFFNLCGPLLNPARPAFSFIGVAEPAVLRLYRYFLETTAQRFCLIHTRGGYDEISLTGPCDSVTNQGAETFRPEDCDYAALSPADLHGGHTLAEAAQIFLNVLQGNGTDAQRAVTLANAAAALHLVRPAWTQAECRAVVTDSLDKGRAYNCFKLLKDSIKQHA